MVQFPISVHFLEIRIITLLQKAILDLKSCREIASLQEGVKTKLFTRRHYCFPI